MRAMILKEFLELRRDRRTVGLIVVMPLMLLIVFGYAANFSVDSVRTEVMGDGAQRVVSTLRDPLEVTTIDPAGTEETAREHLRNKEADVVVVAGGGSAATAYIDGSRLFPAQSALGALAKTGGAVKPEVLFNPDLKSAWVMVPALVGLILTFIGTLVTSMGLVRERQSGTLEQLAVMPFRPSDVITGKIAPYFILAALDMVAVTLLGIWLFDVPFHGSVFAFSLGAALFLFVVLGIGVLISTVSQNQGQAVQMALMVMMPQIMLSGMIFPLEAAAPAVRWIGYLFPLTYFTDISQGLMLRGSDTGALWFPFALLAGMAVVVFTMAVLRFRRDLAPSQPAADKQAEPSATPPLTEAGAR